MTLNGSNVCAVIDGKAGINIDDKMKFRMDFDKVHFFDKETEIRLRYEDKKPIDLNAQPIGIKRVKKLEVIEEE